MATPSEVLVTGGAGFIGSHLVEMLLREGHPVTVLDNLSTGHRHQVPEEARFVLADIRDGERLSDILCETRPEVVIHLAGQVNVRKSLKNPDHDRVENVTGSELVFHSSFEAGVRRVIFASSGGAIYGERASYPCREEDVAVPLSPYGRSKLAAEHGGSDLAQSWGREFVALRLGNVYGPRQDPAGEAGVVAVFLSELLLGRAPTLFGDGNQTRDFIWVEDVAHAFLAALRGPGGVYNVGTGVETRIFDLYSELVSILGMTLPPGRVPAIPGEVRRNVLSTERALRILGWQSRCPLSEGLKESVKYYQGGGTRGAKLSGGDLLSLSLSWEKRGPR